LLFTADYKKQQGHLTVYYQFYYTAFFCLPNHTTFFKKAVGTQYTGRSYRLAGG
jgi:hypothetical protein